MGNNLSEEGIRKIIKQAAKIVKINTIMEYSKVYEISIQFWPSHTAIFIAKDGISLKDYGGSFDFAFDNAIEYLQRITGNETK